MVPASLPCDPVLQLPRKGVGVTPVAASVAGDIVMRTQSRSTAKRVNNTAPLGPNSIPTHHSDPIKFLFIVTIISNQSIIMRSSNDQVCFSRMPVMTKGVGEDLGHLAMKP